MFKRFIYNHDWVITAMMGLILTIGIMTIYSTSLYSGEGNFQRQVIFAIVGVGLYFLISAFDYTYLKYRPIVYTLYGLNVLLLILAALVGHNVRGAVRWLNIGLLNLQPSEVAKATLIIALASFLAFAQRLEDKQLFGKTFLILLPLAVLVFLEPSLSSTIVLVAIWATIFFLHTGKQLQNLLIALALLIAINMGGAFLMPKVFFLPVVKDISIGIVPLSLVLFGILYFAKITSAKTLGLTLLVGILIGFSLKYIVWTHVLHAYQRERITAFISQNSTSPNDPNEFQIRQSKIAIGSGELLGKGFAQGTQSKLNFLPDHNTDFIFASFSEEFGLLGDSILLGLFSVMLFRLISITEKVTDRFGFAIMVGVIAMMTFQTFVNIGINVGLLPSTGIPMPFVSYGGSALWVSFIMLGLTQSIYKQTQTKKWQNIDI